MGWREDEEEERAAEAGCDIKEEEDEEGCGDGPGDRRSLNDGAGLAVLERDESRSRICRNGSANRHDGVCAPLGRH
jgi:hypothetical protein